jgi:hypothetical protein
MKLREAVRVVIAALLIPLASCSRQEQREESIRDRVVAASQGYRDPAEMRTAAAEQRRGGPFHGTGFAQAFDGGDWVVEDPFTGSTKFFPGCSLVSHTYPYKATRQVLARSLKSEQQVFLIVSSDATLKTRLDQKMAEWGPDAATGFPERLRSADGLELTYRVYHIRPGLVGGEELLLEVAFSEENGRLLLLDAGLSYGRPASPSALRGQPHAHATLQQLVPGLTLRDVFEDG